MVTSNKPIENSPKLDPETFVLKQIAELKTKKYKGIHVVRSGLNQLFRKYYAEEGFDPIETTARMRKEGKIAVFLSKGGASLYLREDLQQATLMKHDADWLERDKSPFVKKSTI